MFYLDDEDDWVKVTSSGTFNAQAVWTDSLGSGSITLNCKSEFDEDDEHGVD